MKFQIKTKLHPHLQMFAPVCCVLFLVMLSVMVLSQMDVCAAAAQHKGTFLLFMTCTAVGVVALSIWSLASHTHITCQICALGILLGVASSYQLLFDYGNFCTYVLYAVAAALAAYFLWRNVDIIPDLFFYGLAILPVMLMVLLRLFGTVSRGAYLTLWGLRVGEYVKVMLILLGASSHVNNKRKMIYCAITMICLLLFLLCKDLGPAVLLFVIFVMNTYLLFDNKKLSLGIIILAVVGLFYVVNFTAFGAHALSRFKNCFHAMDDPTGQQHNFIRAVLAGGFGGLGFEYSHIVTNVFAIEHDGALMGVMAMFGFPMIVLVMAAYAAIAITPAYNRSVHPTGYLILAQMSAYVVCHSVLNLCGAGDVLPFTGITGPIISEGGQALLCFGGLMGLSIAALHPKITPVQEV